MAVVAKRPLITPAVNRYEVLATEGSTSSADRKKCVPPPIVLGSKDVWLQITTMMTNKNINFTKAKALQDGINIQPTTTEDHRKLMTLLDEVGIQYHTYLLPEEKPLKVVIRSVLEALPYICQSSHGKFIHHEPPLYESFDFDGVFYLFGCCSYVQRVCFYGLSIVIMSMAQDRRAVIIPSTVVFPTIATAIFWMTAMTFSLLYASGNFKVSSRVVAFWDG